MVLSKLIREEVIKYEKYFNEYLEIEEDEKELGRVYLQYNFDMKRDRFRIVLFPKTTKGKIIFYCSSQYMSTFYESMAKQFKEYCIALEGVEATEEEYRKIWADVTGMYGGPFLVKVDFKKGLMDEQTGTNNIPNILDEKRISIRELSLGINMDYAGTYRLVNRTSLNTTTLKTLLKIANYLNIEIQDLYK